MEVEDRQMKVKEVVEAVPGQKMGVGFSRTSGRFALDEGLLVGQCRSDCSRSRLRGSVVLRMRLVT